MDPETAFLLLASKHLDNNMENDDNKGSNNLNNNNSNNNNKDLERKIDSLEKKLNKISDLEKNLEFRSKENHELELFLVSKISQIETKLEKLERVSDYKKVISHEKLSKINLSENEKELNNTMKKLDKLKRDFNISYDSKKSKTEAFYNFGSFNVDVDDDIVDTLMNLKNKLNLLMEEYEKIKDSYPEDLIKEIEEKILNVESKLYKVIKSL